MTRSSENNLNSTLTGLGLSLVAGGALIGAAFLGTAAAHTDGGAGTYALKALPESYGALGFNSKDLQGGVRQAQDGYYCYYYYGYYGCCYYTSDGQYCCYYYGYYYCYDDNGGNSRSGENFNEGSGFAALKPSRGPLKKEVNTGGFARADKKTTAGSLAYDSGGYSGAGSPAEAAGYNNTFL